LNRTPIEKHGSIRVSSPKGFVTPLGLTPLHEQRSSYAVTACDDYVSVDHDGDLPWGCDPQFR